MNLKKILQPCILLLIVTITILSVKTPSYAEEPAFDVTISPQYFDLSTTPNSVIKQKFRIHNNGSTPLNLTIQIKSLSSDDLGKAALEEPLPKDESIKYIQLPIASFSALPKEWMTIPFTISIPKNSNYGYYWALLISSHPPKTAQGVGAKINGAVAIPILLDVNKEGAIVDGSIQSLKTDNAWYEYPPINFLTKFINSGTLHAKPRGNIFITDWTGKEVGNIAVNKELGAILPHSQRTFTSTWDNSFITAEDTLLNGEIVTDKKGQPIKKLQIHFDKLLDLRIGKYSAHAFMVVSGPKKDYSYEATTSFIVFPWKIILGTLVIAAFITIGIINTTKSLVRKVTRIKNYFKQKRNKHD